MRLTPPRTPRHTPRHVPRTSALAAVLLLASLAGCGVGGEGTKDDAQGRGQGENPTSRSASEGGRPFTLVATGDILSHASIIRQAKADAGGGDDYDFRPMLAGAKPTAATADLAICHMETIYGPDEGPFTGYPMFVTPPQVAAAIKDAGYDSCSTASNHTLDAGQDGVERTLGAMDEAGVRHVGSARSAAESRKPALLKAGGAKVAQLSYTYGTNGIPVPEGKDYLVNLLDPKKIIADARAARRAGADVVVTSVHWGDEWQEEPNAQQLEVAKELTAARTKGRRDIDLVLGTHNHVPQPYEKVNGTWVVYGLGDQVAGVMNDPRGQLGSAARFTFVPPREEKGAWTVKKAEFIPFAMTTQEPYRTVNLNSGDARQAGTQNAASQARVREAVLSRGADKDGLVMGR